MTPWLPKGSRVRGSGEGCSLVTCFESGRGSPFVPLLLLLLLPSGVQRSHAPFGPGKDRLLHETPFFETSLTA